MTDAPPTRPSREGHADDALVRPERPGDDVPAVHRAAFADHAATVLAMVDALRTDPDAQPCTSLVAERDGVVVGHVLLSTALLDAPRRLVPVRVLSPLAVHPDHQRRGLGASLVRAGLAAVAAAGAPIALLEGDPAYYGRLGFRPGDELGLRRPSLRIPAAAFQAVLLPAHEPWMTGTLVYPALMWRLDAVGLRDPRA